MDICIIYTDISDKSVLSFIIEFRSVLFERNEFLLFSILLRYCSLIREFNGFVMLRERVDDCFNVVATRTKGHLS